ncbi:MAG: hypothetical protein RIK87_25145 [Fuerstiella sp.]
MSSTAIQLPDATRHRLEEYRQLVRRIKVTEAVLAGVFGLALSYVAVFLLDRLVDTAPLVRAALLTAGCLGFGLFFPLKCHRWVWKTRRMEQVATLVKQRFPGLGDQLLGVVELSRENARLGTSETLARAAVDFVDREVRDRDLSGAVPAPRHKAWAAVAAVPVLLTVLALLVVPAAGSNALQRWLMPWRDVDRYTFAQVADLPPLIVVPHGEEFEFAAELSPDTRWSPAHGLVRFNDQSPVMADLQQNRYRFQVPPQTETGHLSVRIGDIRETLDVQVATRPELTALTAAVELPDYLQYSKPLQTDVRGGVVSILKGSVTRLAAEVSRPLKTASLQGQPVRVDGTAILSPALTVEESRTLDFHWTDELGLSAKDQFQLKIRAVEDAGPVVSFQQLDSEQVVLSTDVISFDVQAEDDFGLKEIGLEWRGIQNPLSNPNPDAGDKLVGAGGPEQLSFSSKATFCAVSDNVRPQSFEMRAWARDYRPDSERSYSATYVIHVLTPEEHAVWMTSQLRRWASLADDVYEEEMRLHDANRELRRLDPLELNTPANRRRLEQQAIAERVNGQRLGAVTDHGENLIRQAMRNPEMLVGHLETWADSLEALKNIAQNRMPGVADLLASAAQAPAQTAKPAGAVAGAGQAVDMAGNNRSDKVGQGQPGESEDTKPTGAPQLTDIESGFMPAAEKSDDSPPSDSAGKSRLTLPTTVLHGGPSSDNGSPPPAPQQVDEAVEEQADLLAEFARVREDLQKIMDDLENSTFVKRLKAASRQQLEVAEDLNRTLFKSFGMPAAVLDERQSEQTAGIAQREDAQSRSVWMIQTDLEAYYDRRRQPKFLRIIEEMDEVRITTKLTALGDRVRQNLSGESIARAEFWSDTLDRWAEELVEPSPGGT